MKKIKNSNKFREAVLRFLATGRYCPYPDETLDSYNFWREEERRCVEGYTAPDGDYIAGFHYFYLNYSRIEAMVPVEVKTKSGVKIRAARKHSFPEFYDYDYDYFINLERAREEGKHFIVLKRRGSGYSFKGASMLCRNYFCIEGSTSYAIASTVDHLTSDGIISKAWSIMDFCDEHTGFAKRRDKSDTKLVRRASYVETDEYGRKIEKGYKSSIIGITAGSGTGALHGKRGHLFILEEIGSFADSTGAWATLRHSVEEAGTAYGLIVGQGTGGDKDSKFLGLKKMFYDPDSFNILPFDNVWDSGMQGTKCGYFVPGYSNLGNFDENGKRLFMDEDGNTIEDKSIEHILKERAKINNPEQLDKYIAFMPFTPMEAMMDYAGNNFPKRELSEHLVKLQSDPKLKSVGQPGDLFFSGGDLVWRPKKNGDIRNYPLKLSESKEGSIVIYEHPSLEKAPGLYIAGVDPYDFDSAPYSDSLGSMIVYKRFQNFEENYECIVAEYTGRPSTADEFYENCRKLAIYYNASILYENEKKGLYTYFVNKRCDHYLANQPDILSDIVRGSKVYRKKGIHMSTPIIDYSIGKLRDYLDEEYAPGHKNLEKINSIPMLQELIAYNPKGNFDRVRALQCVMIYREQLHRNTVSIAKREEKESSIFSSPLFAQTAYDSTYDHYSRENSPSLSRNRVLSKL